jgi:sulfite reductase alpha subunit-like flavoprotein
MRTIKRKTQKPDMLSGITYTVCGLGDTNYNKFCHTGITLDTRMAQLGAERFYDICCADDGTGMDKDIEPWTQGLWTPLRVACGLEKAAAAPAPAPAPAPVPLPNVGAAEAEAAPEVAPEAAPEAPPAVVAAPPPLELQVVPCEAAAQEAGAPPDASTVAWAAVEEHFGVAGRVFGAPLCGARRLTTPDAVKCVWHAELDVCAEPCDFQPGDALGILCPNPAEEVSALAARLGLELGSWVQLRAAAAAAAGSKVEEELPAHLPPAPCTVGALLTHCVEIRRVTRKALLLALSASCADAAEAATLSLWASKDAAGRQAYKTQIMAAPPTLLELLQAFPSAAPTLGALLLQLVPLAPRYYSVSNSPLGPQGASVATFAFTVVAYEAPPALAAAAAAAAAGGAATSSEAVAPPRLKHGLATSFLARCCEQFAEQQKQGGGDGSASAAQAEPVRVFWKPSQAFHLPSDLSTPCVMVRLSARCRASQPAGIGLANPICELLSCRHPHLRCPGTPLRLTHIPRPQPNHT